MSQGLYACAWAAEFPAQALLRLRTDWQTEAVVVLDGRAPQEWVCSLNRLARGMGAVMGMTRLEAESICGLAVAEAIGGERGSGAGGVSGVRGKVFSADRR